MEETITDAEIISEDDNKERNTKTKSKKKNRKKAKDEK